MSLIEKPIRNSTYEIEAAFTLKNKLAKVLLEHAAKRQREPAELLADVVETVLQDDLIDAVLDDDGGKDVTAPTSYVAVDL
jgi:hypothetical protein